MKPNVHFFGAADGVTGSRTLLTHEGFRLLIDCGLFQGPPDVRAKNWEESVPTDIDAILLTHAHLDHTGYLPRLVRRGYKGPIYCSRGTAALCEILLRDAAFLEEEQAHFANRTKYSRHQPALALFTLDDVEKVLKLLRPVPQHEWVSLNPSISFEMWKAGHIVGASMIRVSLTADQKQKLIVFSGDIGNDRLITMKAPEPLPACDWLVLESTYGDRIQPRCDISEVLAEVLNQTFRRQGIVVVPAFAVGRAQELLVRIAELQKTKRIPITPIILDSPMARQATQIYFEHHDDHAQGFEARLPQTLETVISSDESMLQCMRDGPSLVISAAGMLTGGRILHHLKARLPDPKNTVLFTGYQAEGTKGRYLQENPSGTIRIHHQEIEIAAEVKTLDCLSSHADHQDMEDWLAKSAQLPTGIILNHGQPNAQHALRKSLTQRFGIEVWSSCDKHQFQL